MLCGSGGGLSFSLGVALSKLPRLLFLRLEHGENNSTDVTGLW